MKLICLEFGNKNLILFYFGMTACFAMTVFCYIFVFSDILGGNRSNFFVTSSNKF